MTSVIRGYAEGYYGRLLGWNDRVQILDALARCGMNTYYYAPKEDALHRWQWRTPYGQEWRCDFSQFCEEANRRGISVVAGIAPGLDFDFHDLAGGADLDSLVSKARQLRYDGAAAVSLLMDDIDASFAQRSAGISSEGLAHGMLANELAQHLSESVWVTPRIYANELALQETSYLPAFLGELHTGHSVLYCGSDVVSRIASAMDIRQVCAETAHRLVLWDNLYANDYCPRRLFVGPWEGREWNHHVLLNPTGGVKTDCLLLDLMHASNNHQPVVNNAVPRTDDPKNVGWADTLQRHSVPDAFLKLAPWFHHPVFNDRIAPSLPEADADTFDALEACLWEWKTPLSREWYAHIVGLKHDLQIAAKALPAQRIEKTQNWPLADYLINKRPG